MYLPGITILSSIGHKVCTAVSVEIVVCWVLLWCNLVGAYKHFRETCCFHLQGWRDQGESSARFYRQGGCGGTTVPLILSWSLIIHPSCHPVSVHILITLSLKVETSSCRICQYSPTWLHGVTTKNTIIQRYCLVNIVVTWLVCSDRYH